MRPRGPDDGERRADREPALRGERPCDHDGIQPRDEREPVRDVERRPRKLHLALGVLEERDAEDRQHVAVVAPERHEALHDGRHGGDVGQRGQLLHERLRYAGAAVRHLELRPSRRGVERPPEGLDDRVRRRRRRDHRGDAEHDAEDGEGGARGVAAEVGEGEGGEEPHGEAPAAPVVRAGCVLPLAPTSPRASSGEEHRGAYTLDPRLP